jgi:hypothetical protein
VDAIAALFAKGTGDPDLFTRDHSLTLTPPWSPASVAGAGLGRALSHCEIKIVVRLPSGRFQAAATASRHVVIAAARRTRCV